MRPWPFAASKATGTSPSGEKVYDVRGESGRDAISVYDPITGRSTLLFELSQRIASGLSLSPDERYLLFSQVDDEGSELMLADNFR